MDSQGPTELQINSLARYLMSVPLLCPSSFQSALQLHEFPMTTKLAWDKMAPAQLIQGAPKNQVRGQIFPMWKTESQLCILIHYAS